MSRTDPTVFARHLDLGPLHGRRRGLVVCVFHEERTPSLSVDLDRGVFNCFGCGARGGLRRFAELVGDSPAVPLTATLARAPLSPMAAARAEILRTARAQRWARPGILLEYGSADLVRAARAQASRLQDQATRAGDTPAGWRLVAAAAELEREAHFLEAALERLAA